MSYQCIQGHFTDKEHENKNCPYDSKGKIDKLIDKYSDSPSEDKVKQEIENHVATEEEINTLYGKEFKGYKGQDAINKILQEKQGHVKGAFSNKDFESIDLIWGNGNVGVSHIIKQREKEKIGHADIVLSNLSRIIDKAEFFEINKKGNFVYKYKENKIKYFVVIAPSYHNRKVTYVLTAFDRYKTKK